MIHYDRRTWLVATCLSALAGYVDAIGYLELGGFFVSFMTGNSTRMGVGLAQGSADAVVAGALVLGFVAGVVAGSMAGHLARDRRRPVVLALVSVLLAIAASASAARFDRVAIGAIVLAMGAENAIFERRGEVSIGLTYMTGTLVKLGQRVTSALLGEGTFAWIPYLMLWLGLVAGAAVGATVHPRLGLSALWGAAGVSAILAVLLGLGGSGRRQA